MIDLYLAGTANGLRASVALDEAALPYRAHKVDLSKGEQRTAEFLKLNPAGLIPVIVDQDGPGGKPLTLSQSGAIILHLAERTGRMLPRDATRRQLALQWFMQAMTDVAPASAILFVVGSLMPEATNNSRKLFEQRLIGHLKNADRRLSEAQFLADEISIADIALYPTVSFRREIIAQSGELPYLMRWLSTMDARPAVQRGMAVPND